MYGIKDLSAPFIQDRGSMGDLVRKYKRTALIGMYRLELDGWYPVAKKYYGLSWTHQKDIHTL